MSAVVFRAVVEISALPIDRSESFWQRDFRIQMRVVPPHLNECVAVKCNVNTTWGDTSLCECVEICSYMSRSSLGRLGKFSLPADRFAIKPYLAALWFHEYKRTAECWSTHRQANETKSVPS